MKSRAPDVIVTWLQNDYGLYDRVGESLAHALVESDLAGRVAYVEPPIGDQAPAQVDLTLDEGLHVYRVHGQAVQGPDLAAAIVRTSELRDPVHINVGSAPSNWWFHYAFAPYASTKVLIALEPLHLWPGLAPESARYLARVRDTLTAAADQVWGISVGAIADLPDARYLGMACDRRMEAIALDDLPEPSDLAHLARPRALYSGALSARVDATALTALADRGIQVVVIGHAPTPQLLSIMARHPGITYLGPRKAADMPAYYRHCDLGIIPHTNEPLTRAMEPRKLYNYCAAGLPSVLLNCVVPEALSALVTPTATVPEFVEGCLTHLDGSRMPAGDVQVARRTTWRSLAKRVLEHTGQREDAARDRQGADEAAHNALPELAGRT